MAPTEIIVQLMLACISTVMSIIIGFYVKRIVARNDRQDKESEAMKNAMRAILRDRIIQADIRFTPMNGISSEQKQNIELLYSAYHILGGNGVVTSAYKHLMALPLTKA